MQIFLKIFLMSNNNGPVISLKTGPKVRPSYGGYPGNLPLRRGRIQGWKVELR